MTTTPNDRGTSGVGSPVSVRWLTKVYGRHTVLDAVSLEIPAGSFTTLLGPSGSGKTTTLNIVAGVVTPESGQVLIAGKDCTRTPIHRRNVGFVFQSYALFPHMTVERNVGYALRVRGTTRNEIQHRVHEALDMVGLLGHRRHLPAQLSGGQQQRVALARAVVFRPAVLLMDEPLGALDAALRAQLQREIVRLGRELGMTIIYVTHDQEEALTMSDQVALFSTGTIEQSGPPSTLYEAPDTEFVAGFVGEALLARGTLVGGPGAYGVESTHGRVPVRDESVQRLAIGTGTGAAAVLRSEHLRLLPVDQPANPDNASLGRGRVVDRVYAGPRTRVTIRLDSGATLAYAYDTGTGPDWRDGDDVLVQVRADRLPPAVPVAGPQPAPVAPQTAEAAVGG